MLRPLRCVHPPTVQGRGRAPFTAAQVGQVVGSGVHHDTAVFTAECALSDIKPTDGIFRYASAYTGVDSFATGVISVLERRRTNGAHTSMTYVYAAELKGHLREAALRAWSPYGLTESNIMTSTLTSSRTDLCRLYTYSCSRPVAPPSHRSTPAGTARTKLGYYATCVPPFTL